MGTVLPAGNREGLLLVSSGHEQRMTIDVDDKLDDVVEREMVPDEEDDSGRRKQKVERN